MAIQYRIPVSFVIEQRETEGILVLAPKGRFVAGEPVSQFRETLDAALAAGRAYVVLDFRGVDYIDSSALGCLVTAHTRFAKTGGQLPMYGLNERGLELMVVTKLSTVFRIFDNEVDAVDSCFPGRTAKSFDVLSFVRKAREARASRAAGKDNPA
jgi:anti-sigma B factor antagonist